MAVDVNVLGTVHTVRADRADDQPYSVTHGGHRADYNRRRDAVDAAYDRMEGS